MTALAGYGSSSMAIVRRDIWLFLSYRTRLYSQALALLFSITLFHYLSRLVSVGQFKSSHDYFGFAIVGIAIIEVVNASLAGLPPKLRQELVGGTFERMVLSPAGAVSATAAMLIFPLAFALLTGCFTLCLAVLLFGLHLHAATAPIALPVAMLAAVAFAPFALVIGALVLAVKQAGTLSGFVVTGLSLIGGFFFPVSLLPWWIRWVSDVQPFTPALDLLRHLLIGTPLLEAEWVSVLKLAGFAVVLLPVGILALTAALRFVQRRGTVIEY
jgi:ABC-2 type transport system permease protein